MNGNNLTGKAYPLVFVLFPVKFYLTFSMFYQQIIHTCLSITYIIFIFQKGIIKSVHLNTEFPFKAINSNRLSQY